MENVGGFRSLVLIDAGDGATFAATDPDQVGAKNRGLPHFDRSRDRVVMTTGYLPPSPDRPTIASAATVGGEGMGLAYVRTLVRRVGGGQKALDLLYGPDGTGNPDRPDPLLLLPDMNMAGVNGYQVMKNLKSHNERHKIPVIILTTTDDPREIDNAYAMGANANITKPVELTNFIKTIGKLGLFLQIVYSPHLR